MYLNSVGVHVKGVLEGRFGVSRQIDEPVSLKDVLKELREVQEVTLEVANEQDWAASRSVRTADRVIGLAPPLKEAEIPELPSCFRCPISTLWMRDPVRANDGQHYDRASISAWFDHCEANQLSPTSPWTGKVLSSARVTPARGLKAALIAFFKCHPELKTAELMPSADALAAAAATLHEDADYSGEVRLRALEKELAASAPNWPTVNGQQLCAQLHDVLNELQRALRLPCTTPEPSLHEKGQELALRFAEEQQYIKDFKARVGGLRSGMQPLLDDWMHETASIYLEVALGSGDLETLQAAVAEGKALGLSSSELAEAQARLLAAPVQAAFTAAVYEQNVQSIQAAIMQAKSFGTPAADLSAGYAALSCMQIGNMAKTPQGRSTVLERKAIPEITQAARVHLSVAFVQCAAFRALIPLSTSRDTCEEAVELGIVDVIMKALIRYRNDVNVLDPACRLLAMLCRVEKARRISMEGGIIGLVANVMTSHLHQPDLRQAARGLLGELSSHDYEVDAREDEADQFNDQKLALMNAARTGKMTVLQRAIDGIGVDAFNSDDLAAAWIILLLSNITLAAGDDEGLSRTVGNGGASTVVKAMRAHSRFHDVQEVGCRTLNLITKSSDGKAQARAAGAVGVIVEAKKRFPRAVKFQELANATLVSLEDQADDS